MDIDQTVAEPGLRQFLRRFFAWGAAPTVDGYADLFDPEGTLLDAGMEQPLRGEAIRTSMSRTLALIPDFRFAPRHVVGGGHTVFVEAVNRATLEGRALRWEAVYCITERAGRVRAGRRYYDQAELYAPLRPGQAHPLAPAGLPPPPAPNRDRAAPAPPATSGLDLERRARAWGDGDLDTLLAPWAATAGPGRFDAPGAAPPGEGTDADAGAGAHADVGADADGGRSQRSAGPISPAAVRGYLAALLALLAGPELRLAGEARHGDVVALEWRGRAGAVSVADRFGLVEILDPTPPGRWRLAFDTLSLQGAADVAALREHLQAASGPAAGGAAGSEA